MFQNLVLLAIYATVAKADSLATTSHYDDLAQCNLISEPLDGQTAPKTSLTYLGNNKQITLITKEGVGSQARDRFYSYRLSDDPAITWKDPNTGDIYFGIQTDSVKHSSPLASQSDYVVRLSKNYNNEVTSVATLTPQEFSKISRDGYKQIATNPVQYSSTGNELNSLGFDLTLGYSTITKKLLPLIASAATRLDTLRKQNDENYEKQLIKYKQDQLEFENEKLRHETSQTENKIKYSKYLEELSVLETELKKPVSSATATKLKTITIPQYGGIFRRLSPTTVSDLINHMIDSLHNKKLPCMDRLNVERDSMAYDMYSDYDKTCVEIFKTIMPNSTLPTKPVQKPIPFTKVFNQKPPVKPKTPEGRLASILSACKKLPISGVARETWMRTIDQQFDQIGRKNSIPYAPQTSDSERVE